MQINRLFEIIYILLDRKSITSNELAQRFEVSARTIYRDIETLSSAGIPIYMKKGKGGGISLLPDFVLNKTVLTENEKTDILSALNAVRSISFNKTDTAINKLSLLFGEGNADWIEVDFSSWSNADEESAVFNMLKSAILKRKVAKFLYSNGKSETNLREVEPIKLCFKGQSWYLYAYCKRRQDFRFFKLRRIKELSVLDETFEKRPHVKVFSQSNRFNDEFIKLKLKVSKNMAYRVYDEFQNYKELEDGSFIAEIMFPKGEWIFSYITSFGEDCEVISPKEIRTQIKRKLQNTLLNYL